MAAWAGVIVVVLVTWSVLDSWQEQSVCDKCACLCGRAAWNESFEGAILADEGV